jgi:hypothetical protein
VQRNRRVSDADLSEGILALKFAFAEARETFETAATITFALEALVINFQKREWALDQSRDGTGALDVKNGEGRLGGRIAFGESGGRGMIPDGEILHAAVAIEADAASADSSQRHGELHGSVALKGALRPLFEEFLGRVRTRLSLGCCFG